LEIGAYLGFGPLKGGRKNFSAKIQSKECTLCCSCVEMCDANALRLIEEKIEIIDLYCTKCGLCVEVCPLELISLDG